MPDNGPPRHGVRPLTTIVAALVVMGVIGTVASASEPLPTAPVAVYAIGDSITNAWGALGDATAHPERSWATGTDESVLSWVRRLAERMPPGTTVDGVNLAVAGSKTTDANGVVGQAASVGADADIVLVGVGSADLCMSNVDDVADLTPPATFRQKIDDALAAITATAPGAKIFVSSVPNWYQVWETVPDKPQRFDAVRGWTCPLLFQTGLADDSTRDAFRTQLLSYNAALQDACAAVTACRFDGQAAYELVLQESELSTTDYFHPSLAGQQKLAEATWGAGWYAMPDAVTGFAAVGGVESVALTWDALPATATGVVIRQKTGAAPTGPTDGAPVFSGTGTATTLSALTPGLTYFFGAFAFDVDGAFGPGAFASATPTAATVAAAGASGGGGAPAATTERPLPDLAVSMSVGPERVGVGGLLTYRIAVTDKNRSAAPGVILSVDLPDAVTLVSAQADRGPGCTGERRLTCRLDFVSDPAAAVNVQIVVRVERAGELVAVAAVDAEQADGDPADNRASVVVVAAPARAPSARLLSGIAARIGVARESEHVATVSARVAADAADILEVSIVPGRNNAARLTLLRRSRVGTAVTGYWRKTISYHFVSPEARARVDLRLRVPVRLLRAGVPYVLRLVARDLDSRNRAVISIRFSG